MKIIQDHSEWRLSDVILIWKFRSEKLPKFVSLMIEILESIKLRSHFRVGSVFCGDLELRIWDRRIEM